MHVLKMLGMWEEQSLNEHGNNELYFYKKGMQLELSKCKGCSTFPLIVVELLLSGDASQQV